MKPRIRVGTCWRLGHMKEDSIHWVCFMDTPNRTQLGSGPTPEAAYADWLERNPLYKNHWSART